MPQTYAKFGANFETLRQARPDIILARLPAYGLDGPYATYRAAGRQMESLAGHNWLRGYRDESTDEASDLISVRGTTYLADAVGGASLAFAIVTALCHRKATGEGQLVEVASAEAVVHHVAESVIDYELNGRIQGPWAMVIHRGRPRAATAARVPTTGSLYPSAAMMNGRGYCA